MNSMKVRPVAVLVSMVLASSFSVSSAFAAQGSEAPKAEGQDAQKLETITVRSKYVKRARPANASGLGLTQKNANVIQKQQIENIRDLVRLDPGISVNEAGGRGGSRGFSIHGVEKERVGVTVDGLGSIPMLRRLDRNGAHGQSRSSAATNEVEYENLKAVNLQKGSSSVEAGSGGLGGSVAMTTKDTSDFFEPDSDKLYAGRIKGGYTTKDRRWVASAGIAGRYDRYEGFIQATKRKGHEIRAHEDLYKQNFFIKSRQEPAGRWFDMADVSGEDRKVPNPLDYDSQSILSKFGVLLTPEHYIGAVIDYTKQDYLIREMMLANFKPAGDKDETGRIKNSTGREDLTVYGSDWDNGMEKLTPTQHYLDNHENNRLGLEYRYEPAKGRFVDRAKMEVDHREIRIKSSIIQLNCAKWPSVDVNCWPDTNGLFTGALPDNKKPETIKNLVVFSIPDQLADTPLDALKGKYGVKKTADLQEKDWRWAGEAEKRLKLGSTRHELKVKAGYTDSQYTLIDSTLKVSSQGLGSWTQKYYVDKVFKEVVKNDRGEVVMGKDGQPKTVEVTRRVVETKPGPNGDEVEVADYYRTFDPKRGFDNTYNKLDNLKSRAAFISFSDRMKWKKLEVSAGARYDYLTYADPHPTDEQLKLGVGFQGAKHSNVSWDLGLAYELLEPLKLKARVSTGFRFPTIVEQIGPAFNISATSKSAEDIRNDRAKDIQGPLKKETSITQEIGFDFVHPVFKLSGSYFISTYKNVIDFARKEEGDLMYYNVHNFSTHGFDVKAKVDAYALWNKLPEGLEVFVNTSLTKVYKKDRPASGLLDWSDYAFDSIQPLRVVTGITYNAPNEKWGISYTNTWSAAKDPSELTARSKTGGLVTEGSRFASMKTPAWAIADMTGYYKPRKNITIRGGIYNIFNYKYVTWENLRQTSFGLDARMTTDNYVALAAPGRNFYISAEIKF